MNPLVKVTALPFVVVCAAASLQAQADQTVSPGTATQDRQSSKQTAQSVLRMARDIERQVLRLTEYSLFDEIRFTIQNYVVTLRGSASRPILKSVVEQVVRKIEGVENVINEIEVLPPKPFR